MVAQKLAMKVNNVRDHNIRLIMAYLYKKPYSCLELSKKIGISDVGIRKIIKELEELDIVRRKQEKNVVKTRGNQHIRYVANKDLGVFLLIDFTQRKERFLLYDFSGKELLNERFEAPYEYQTEEEIIQLLSKIRETIQVKGLGDKKILHTTVAITGQTDEKAHSLVFSRLFGVLKDDETGRLYSMFEETFGAPVTIKNNVTFMAIGDGEINNRKDSTMSLFVYVGFGIASSILYQGKPLFASRGYAGEIGSGRLGFGMSNTTLSSICSIKGLIRECSIRGLIDCCDDYLEKKNFEELLRMYNNNQTVRETILERARLFGIAIGDFASSIGADKIILNGEILEFGEEYARCVEEGIANEVYHPQLILSKTDNAIVGMLKIAREEMIDQLIEEKNR